MKSIISKIVMIAIILQVTQSRAASTVTVATDKSGFSAADVGAINLLKTFSLTLTTEQRPSNTDGYEGTPVVGFVVAQTGTSFPFEKGYLTLVLNDIRDMMYVPRLQAAYAFKNVVRIDQIESVKLDESKKSILITRFYSKIDNLIQFKICYVHIKCRVHIQPSLMLPLPF